MVEDVLFAVSFEAAGFAHLATPPKPQRQGVDEKRSDLNW